MVVDDLFRIVHAAVTDLDGVAIEDFSKLVVSREVMQPTGSSPSTTNNALVSSVSTKHSTSPPTMTT